MSLRLVEMGLRDGLQNEKIILDVDTRFDFAERLIAAGVKNLETGAMVSSKWVPQMEGSDELHKRLQERKNAGGYKKTQLTTLVPNLKGLERALAVGAKEIAVFTAASETFSKANTNVSIKESLERIKAVVSLAKKMKVKVRGYISTCYYCPFEGRTKEARVLKLADQLMEWGVYELSIGDTIGAATPKEVASLNKKLIRTVGKKNLAMHFHNTRGTALANILQSLDQGIETFDSSVGGLGGCPYAPGAAGNVATEDVVYMLHGMGLKTGYDLEKLAEVNSWISEKVNRRLTGAKPFKKHLPKGLQK